MSLGIIIITTVYSPKLRESIHEIDSVMHVLILDNSFASFCLHYFLQKKGFLELQKTGFYCVQHFLTRDL